MDEDSKYVLVGRYFVFSLVNKMWVQLLWYNVVEFLELQDVGPTAAVVDKRKNSKDRSRILQMVDEEIYSHVQNYTSAKLGWDTLAKIYDDRGLSRPFRLLRRLITTSLN